ncbi:hypothetical protein CWO89_35940 [Bradyrhizobium sp. Leo170]|nr:hypothetical protein CWO89_35940 [Bradyrhizobium sp. Leo170]
MRAADCKPYRPFYELLTGKELPWPKAASVVGLFHIRMSPIGPARLLAPRRIFPKIGGNRKSLP